MDIVNQDAGFGVANERHSVMILPRGMLAVDMVHEGQFAKGRAPSCRLEMILCDEIADSVQAQALCRGLVGLIEIQLLRSHIEGLFLEASLSIVPVLRFGHW